MLASKALLASSLLLAAPVALPVASPVGPMVQEAPPRAEREGLRETVKDVDTLKVLVTRELRSRLAPVREHSDEDAVEKQMRIPKDGRWLADEQVDGAWEAYGEVFRGTEAKTFAYTSDSTSFTRAFYAPGVGVWIDTTVRVPVQTVATREAADSDGKAPDTEDAREWESARDEAQGGNSAFQALSSLGYVGTAPAARTTMRLDPKAIESVIDGAVEVLGRHAHRVRHVDQDESFVVALQIDGNYAGSDTFSGLFVTGATRHDLSQTVIVRASKSALDAYAAGELDLGALEKRLSITRY